MTKKEEEKLYRKSDREYMQQTGRLPAGGYSRRSLRIREEYLNRIQKEMEKIKREEPKDTSKTKKETIDRKDNHI